MRSVGIVGQRMVPRVEPPVPPVMRQLQRIPLITPIALALAVVIGDDGVALAPIANSALHAGLSVLVGAALGGAVYGASYLLQQRLTGEVQALAPRT